MLLLTKETETNECARGRCKRAADAKTNGEDISNMEDLD